jgi:diguanylate cyclase (GGDEF)-like protein
VGTSTPKRVDSEGEWYSPHRAIVLLGVILIGIAVAGGTLGVVNSSRAQHLNATLGERYLVIGPHVRNVRAGVADFQVQVERAIGGPTVDTSVLPVAVADSNETDSEYLDLRRLLALPGNRSLAPHLAKQMATYIAARSNLGAFLAGERPSAQTTANATAERAADVKLDAALGSLQAALTSRIALIASQAKGAADAARVDLLWSLALGVTVAAAITTLFARKALRVEHESARWDAVQLSLTTRNEFEGRLQRALEMSKAEEPVFTLVTEALNVAASDRYSELLLADSSRARFQQVLVNTTEPGEAGCGVMSPEDCPAAARGQTMVFPSSTAIDACPNLRGRNCSALCVPVSISGSSVGVFHVTGEEGVECPDEVRSNVEVVARRASERLAMLRAFEVSRREANSDSLTGLVTRRSLESEVRNLQEGGVPYAVAYGDLDHFKQLNDVFGHEAGDRALRAFSQVLRDSLRPADTACRYGGEEFVIVLPSCPVAEAAQVLERVRRTLADRINAAHLPVFTVSFGLASSDEAGDFKAVVALADEALLRAKNGGRDSIVVSSGSAAPSTEDPGGAPSSWDMTSLGVLDPGDTLARGSSGS